MAGSTLEPDVVVVGAGGGGLAAAISAHDSGLRAVVVEAMDKVGGATAFSGGQVWVANNHLMRDHHMQDSYSEAIEYVVGIADDRGLIDRPVAEQWLAEAPKAAEYLARAGAITWEVIPGYPDYYFPDAPGSKAAGRYLTGAPFPGATLGAARARLLTTPHFPLGVTYADVFESRAAPRGMGRLVAERAADDVLTFGTGIAAHLFAAALRREIPILLEHRAIELVQRDDAVVGVVCDTSAGHKALFGDVILATSTYDWDPELVAEYSWLRPDQTGSVAPPTVRGDGIRMARAAGAAIIAIPADAAPHVPGYHTSLTGPADNGFRGLAELSFPHCFLVNQNGQRFCDDSFYGTITRAILGGASRSNYPFFFIWDEQHHQKYGLRPAGPGDPYPPDLHVASAPTVEELARDLGIDAPNLVDTTERFNAAARLGHDPDFHRGEAAFLKMFRGDKRHKPNSVLGPVETPPFHGMPLRLLGTAIGAAGIRTGLHGRALDYEGQPLSGLYAIGAAAAPTTSGTGYNSGFTLSRAITFGHLAARHIHARLGSNSRAW
jgi:3-oxosteroid 1-dehydrogenase